MACADPTAITGGTVISQSPYADGDIAVFQCLTGYIMSGSAIITCTTGAWSTSPSCVQVSSNNITVNNSTNYDFPDWMVYVIAAVCGVIALAILTCMLVCCLQLLGCYGAGGLFGEPKRSFWDCCRRRRSRHERQCTIVPRKYEYDEGGRRFHYDDNGRRCYYPHRNRYIKSTTVVAPETTVYTHVNGKPPTTTTTVSEIQSEKKIREAKLVDIWKPHANPVRNINTSTK